MTVMGTAEGLRRWRDNLAFVDRFQRLHLPDLRSPAEKIRDADALLDLYLSFGYGYPEDNLEARSARSEQIQAGLAALSR